MSDTLTAASRDFQWRSPAVADPGVTTDRLMTKDGEDWTPGERAYDRENGRFCQTGLTQQAEVWQTPATDSFRSRGGARKHEMGLDQQARAFREWRTPQAGDSTRGAKSQRAASYGYRDPAGRHSLVSEVAHWPTPAARDHKGANSEEHVTTNGSGRMHMDQLPNFVAHAFLPSHPDHAILAGPTSSPERRILNPLFVEWLMGWPIGLSGFERSETEFVRWLQQMRGCLSTLCSAPTAPQGRLL